MECSICHKEFGNGAFCQHCGSDRISGLGNYHGYSPSDNDSVENGSGKDYYNGITSGSIVCYSCGKTIPADSKFCPVCSKELFVTCPKCGHEYSSQYPACNKCGTNREKYEEEKVDLERKKLEEEITYPKVGEKTLGIFAQNLTRQSNKKGSLTFQCVVDDFISERKSEVQDYEGIINNIFCFKGFKFTGDISGNYWRVHCKEGIVDKITTFYMANGRIADHYHRTSEYSFYYDREGIGNKGAFLNYIKGKATWEKATISSVISGLKYIKETDNP
jgi:hypothetical protein